MAHGGHRGVVEDGVLGPVRHDPPHEGGQPRLAFGRWEGVDEHQPGQLPGTAHAFGHGVGQPPSAGAAEQHERPAGGGVGKDRREGGHERRNRRRQRLPGGETGQGDGEDVTSAAKGCGELFVLVRSGNSGVRRDTDQHRVAGTAGQRPDGVGAPLLGRLLEGLPEPGGRAEHRHAVGDRTGGARPGEQIDQSRRLDRRRCGGCGLAGERGQVLGEPPRRGVLHGDARRQPQAGRLGEPVAQLDGHQRVEAQIPEGHVERHVGRLAMAEHRGGAVADEVQRRLAARRRLDGRRTDRIHQRAQQPRHAPTLAAQRIEAQRGRHQHRFGRRERGVEERQRVRRRQRRDTGAPDPVQVGVGQVAGHPGPFGPHPPGQRGARQPEAAPVPGQRVEEGVRRRVAALPGVAEHPGDRGEQYERGEVVGAGQLVQVPRRIHLRPQYPIQPLRRERGQHTVVDDATEMENGAERSALPRLVEHGGQRVAVGGVARPDRHVDPKLGQLGV